MLGHKDEDDEKMPRVVESLLGRDIFMAACGVAHTLAVSGEGEREGAVSHSVQTLTVCIPPLTHHTSLSTPHSSLLTLHPSLFPPHASHTASGEVFSWGSGFYGRLGHGNLRDRFSPLMIGAPLRGQAVTYIACHEYHSAAVCGESTCTSLRECTRI